MRTLGTGKTRAFIDERRRDQGRGGGVVTERLRAWMRQAGQWLLPALLCGLAIVAAWWFVGVASRRQITQLEGALFQVITLGLGFLGSYVFGKQSAATAAREIIRPHARSAFRRALTHFGALMRLKKTIDGFKASDCDKEEILRTVDALVAEQVATVDDSMEDWRDLVPDEVAKIESRLLTDTPTQR